jgi:hypothetical protein
VAACRVPALANNIRHSGVKITVLHTLSKLDTAESLELLKKMNGDRDVDVRNEALRFLRLREGSGKQQR